MFPIASLQLVFDVLARDNASPTFRQVGDSADRAGKQAETGLNRVSGAAKALGGFLVGAGIVEGFKELYSAAAESQRIAARTQNVITSMGNAANISAEQVGDLAGAIAAKTGVDDEAIQSGQNLLLTFGNIRNEAGKGNDIFNRTSQIMVDMSAAMGTDASGSAIQLGKALNDPIKGITSLSRAGVSFTEEQKTLIRTLVETGDTMGAQQIILGELERQFGGAAEAMATPMDKARVAVGNVAEQIGGYLVPAVDAAATWLTNDFLPAAEDVGGFLGDVLGPVLSGTADTLGFLVDVGGGIVGFFTDLPGPIQAGATALGAFILLKGPVSDLFDTIALKALYVKDAIGNAASGGIRGAAGGLAGFLGGPWGIAIAGAVTGLGFLASALSDSNEHTEEAENFQRELADALRESNGVIDDSVRALAAHEAAEIEVGGDNLLEWAEDLGVALPTVTDALLGNAGAQDELAAAIEARLAILEQETAAGGPRAAAAGEERGRLLELRDAYGELGGRMQGAVEDNERLAGATAESGTAMDSATSTADLYRAGLEDAAEAASDAQRETNLLKTALDVLTGTTVDMIEVESNYQSALADATGALEDMNGTVLDGAGNLNLASEAGRESADVLLGVRDSGNQLIATMVTQGRTADEVAAAERRLRDDFIRTAGQMGITGGAADRLADQILGIPSERSTTVTADTGPAMNSISQFIRSATLTGAVVQVSAALNGAFSWARNAKGNLLEYFASGGLRSMSGDVATIVPPNTWRVIGDRPAGDEAFIPLDGAPRSRAIWKEAGRRMGLLTPEALAQLADGGVIASARYPINIRASDMHKYVRVLGPAEPQGSSGGSANGLLPIMADARNYVMERYGIRNIGGFARRNIAGTNQLSDHALGKAIDIMTSNVALGTSIANDFAFGPARSRFRAENVIWRQAISSNGGPFRRMADRGSITQNHYDHVHVDTYDAGGALLPGYTLAYNGTGKTETVRTAEQEAALSTPRTVIHDNRQIYAQVDPQRLAVEMWKQQRRVERRALGW